MFSILAQLLRMSTKLLIYLRISVFSEAVEQCLSKGIFVRFDRSLNKTQLSFYHIFFRHPCINFVINMCTCCYDLNIRKEIIITNFSHKKGRRSLSPISKIKGLSYSKQWDEFMLQHNLKGHFNFVDNYSVKFNLLSLITG